MPSPSPVRADTTTVAVVTRHAVYLEHAGHGVVPVLTEDAVPVPGGLVIGARAADLPFLDVVAGDPAWVEATGLRLGKRCRWTYRVAPSPRPRWRDPATALARAGELRAVVANEARPVPVEVRPRLEALRGAIARRDRGALATGVHRLLGLGPGLTPSGDDVLCGLLVTWAAAGRARPELDLLRETVVATVHRHASTRTSLVSRALLEKAVEGACVPALAELLDALGHVEDLAPAVRRVVGVGHSSGSDLLRGVLVALSLDAARSAERVGS